MRRSTRARRCACSESGQEPRTQASLDTDRAGRLLGEICRRVDGLPLAIELAAARVVGLDLEDISLHLDDLFDLLPQAARRADGAQRSLRATVEWSDALLTEEERHLLRRMAVFAGGFDLAAIKEVCASDGQTAAKVADLTARLVEKSLLLKQGDSGLYQLLETIRQYAAEQLVDVGELDAIRERHARYYLGVALRESAATLTGPERPHLEVLRRIEDNTRIALECLLSIDPPAALELAASLNFFWWTQGKLREGIGWLERAREAAPDAPAELRATSLFCEGFLVAHDTDDWHAAATLVDVGLDALVGVSEPPLILGMLHCLRGECDVFNGDPKSAVVRTQAGLEISSSYPGTWGRGFCLWNAAVCTAGGRGRGRRHRALHGGDRSGEHGRLRHRRNGRVQRHGRDLGGAWRARHGPRLLGAGASPPAGGWCGRSPNLDDGSADRPCARHDADGAPRSGARGRRSRGTWPRRRSCYARASRSRRRCARSPPQSRWSSSSRKTSQVEPTQRATLRPEGGVWRIDFNGTNVHVPDLKGLWHLRELVSRPREFVPALALIGASSEEPIPRGDTGPLLDREALRQYRRRLAELDDELDDAVVHGDANRQAKRSAERDALIAELKRATGLGGRPRRSGSPAEKARLNVTRTIRHAITDLSTKVPELAAHLDESIVTGVSCCYEPLTNIAWTT